MKQIVICLMLLLSHSVMAQSNLVKGTKYVAVKYGFSKYSFPKFGGAEFGLCFNEKMIWRSGLFYENGNVQSTVFNNLMLTTDYVYNIAEIKNIWSINLGLGGTGGIEYLHSNRNPVKDVALIYGARALTEVDYMINNKISLKGEFAEWYVRQSNLGYWYYTITVGASFNLN